MAEGSGRLFLRRPGGDEEEAAIRLKASDKARFTPKEKGGALVLKRRANAETPGEFCVSLYAVKNHVSSIFASLASRAAGRSPEELANRLAARYGLG